MAAAEVIYGVGVDVPVAAAAHWKHSVAGQSPGLFRSQASRDRSLLWWKQLVAAVTVQIKISSFLRYPSHPTVFLPSIGVPWFWFDFLGQEHSTLLSPIGWRIPEQRPLPFLATVAIAPYQRGSIFCRMQRWIAHVRWWLRIPATSTAALVSGDGSAGVTRIFSCLRLWRAWGHYCPWF